MAAEADCIGDVRGLGAMTAMEFVRDKKTKLPDADICEAITSKCLEQGVILLKAGNAKNVIRVLSPLTISEDDLEKALSIIESSLKEAIGACSQ